MNYRYSELEKDLSNMHEIEFYYNEKKYSISYNSEGWYLTEYGNEEYQSFKSSNELLQNANIDNKSLKEIWKKVIVEFVF